MVQSWEPLLDSGGDGPEHEDEGQVHPPHEGASQHSGIFIKTRDITCNGVKRFVWPRNCKELLPPTTSNICNIETKDKGEWNHVKECIEVFDYTFKQPENHIN